MIRNKWQSAQYLRRKLAGECVHCGKPAKETSVRCEDCYKKVLNANRKRLGQKARV